jgi:Flp pilus assembly protein TadB
MILLLIFACVFGYAWWVGRGVHFLLIGLINFSIALWWLLDFRKKRQHATTIKLSEQRAGVDP